MTPRGEVEYLATDLECGHSTDTSDTAQPTRPAPGAPWAGEQVAVAQTSSLRSLAAARARQDALDHPEGDR